MNVQACQINRIRVAPICAETFCRKLMIWARLRGLNRLVSYLNAHNLNLAFDDPEYGAILRKAELVYADGMGVVWGWRLLGHPLPCRVNAGDFILDFCRHAAAEGVSLYLLGSAPDVAQQAAERWTAAAPGLRIAGTHDGYFSPEDEEAVVAEIRRAAPEILLIGMGVPRQEKWAVRWKEQLGLPVIWCVGALFEYWGAGRSRAPGWMKQHGLEWVWRLALEPRRLWRRYLLGNARFLVNLVRMRQTLRSR